VSGDVVVTFDPGEKEAVELIEVLHWLRSRRPKKHCLTVRNHRSSSPGPGPVGSRVDEVDTEPGGDLEKETAAKDLAVVEVLWPDPFCGQPDLMSSSSTLPTISRVTKKIEKSDLSVLST